MEGHCPALVCSMSMGGEPMLTRVMVDVFAQSLTFVSSQLTVLRSIWSAELPTGADSAEPIGLVTVPGAASLFWVPAIAPCSTKGARRAASSARNAHFSAPLRAPFRLPSNLCPISWTISERLGPVTTIEALNCNPTASQDVEETAFFMTTFGKPVA